MDWPLLVIFVMVCELVGISGGYFTARAIPTWYVHLKKPSFNPPNWVFAPVWIILYALQGIAAYLIFRSDGNGIALVFFIVQLLLNAMWTPLFFAAKRLGAAFFEIILLWASIVLTIVLFSGMNAVAAWLMVPYILWVSFAAVLNYNIWKLNHG